MNNIIPYSPKNKLRIVTAGSLFDGHDVAINIMRRIMQNSGCEVIHLGHDRSADEVVRTAIQEDVQAIAVTSYQGGHIEYFKYLFDLLKEKNAAHIKIFGGGGGVIIPNEIKELEEYGITKIYSPDDGIKMGLQGMINDMLMKSDYCVVHNYHFDWDNIIKCDFKSIARIISFIENTPSDRSLINKKLQGLVKKSKTLIIGLTGTGGAGKSSLMDEIIRRFLIEYKNIKIAVISVDPSKRKTGGALLGDRIRMNSINNQRVYMRSLATRDDNTVISSKIDEILFVLKAANFDFVFLETSGIGQSDTAIVDRSDISLYVMTPEFGAPTQLEKINMLDYADIVAINKFDKNGSLDALSYVKKQYKRNHDLWEVDDDKLPVYGVIAARFNDYGTDCLFHSILNHLKIKNSDNPQNNSFNNKSFPKKSTTYIISPNRIRYLSEIAESNRAYDKWVLEQSEIAHDLYCIHITNQNLKRKEKKENDLNTQLNKLYEELLSKLDDENKKIIFEWKSKIDKYKSDIYSYTVRKNERNIKTFNNSLSGSRIPKVALPTFTLWSDILLWSRKENVPGEFPYTAGIYPFKRNDEMPTRMFAGEGNPERTNARFHYLSKHNEVKRLSTAFDSVTLYGQDPDFRPDIFGKIGNAGVSVSCLDDIKKLYSGFNLLDSKTSVSMTINGPAPIILAYFMNAAIDQQCELYILSNGITDIVDNRIKELYDDNELKRPSYHGHIPKENDGLGLMLLGITGDQVLSPEVYHNIKKSTLTNLRGTVQADILKEDQAQNTCIFSTEFALRMMGDVQEYFVDNKVRNFYSVSISGYHIAEAGANPITQLAFTLANGFTYVEYYLSRGMNINDFAPNLSFFFSNGLDPEYAVIGRVARRIWSKAMKYKYKANSRSQMLKYHIQTSGRSLHAQEVDFNDIRTTLQALYAIYDNCNSLHTNAYDEAITTPTEESVRRAMAIQLIINSELGLSKNENPMQGSYIIEELTDLVEEAVLIEFDKITERGGVLGAMEMMYQRSKIQDESLYYESLKNSGEYPIIGVNTFIGLEDLSTNRIKNVFRSSYEEKLSQINNVNNTKKINQNQTKMNLDKLKNDTINSKNVFESLMNVSKYCSLGQISNALFEVGGKYRRNM